MTFAPKLCVICSDLFTPNNAREAAIVAISTVIVELVQLGFDRLRYELNKRSRKKRVARKRRKPTRGR